MPKDAQQPEQFYTEEETVKRRDAALARALSTPPKRYGQYKGKSTKEPKPSAKA